MPFQWLQMRISEEKDRRKREAATQENLPRAVEELHNALTDCLQTYQQAFASEAATLHLQGSKIRVIAREEVDGKWQQSAKVEVFLVPALPGFQIDNGTGGEPQLVNIGLLPNGNLFYRDPVEDKYITLEELTRRVLDRAFFPKLKE